MASKKAWHESSDYWQNQYERVIGAHSRLIEFVSGLQVAGVLVEEDDSEWDDTVEPTGPVVGSVFDPIIDMQPRFTEEPTRDSHVSHLKGIIKALEGQVDSLHIKLLAAEPLRSQRLDTERLDKLDAIKGIGRCVSVSGDGRAFFLGVSCGSEARGYFNGMREAIDSLIHPIVNTPGDVVKEYGGCAGFVPETSAEECEKLTHLGY